MPPIFRKKFDDLEVTVWDNRPGGDIVVFLDNKQGGTIKLLGTIVTLNDAIVLLGSARDKVIGML